MTTPHAIPLLATYLLAQARAASPTLPAGAVSHPVPGYGHAVVTWDRVARRYDVGTEARSLATGRRADVLPALEELLRRAG